MCIRVGVKLFSSFIIDAFYLLFETELTSVAKKILEKFFFHIHFIIFISKYNQLEHTKKLSKHFKVFNTIKSNIYICIFSINLRNNF